MSENRYIHKNFATGNRLSNESILEKQKKVRAKIEPVTEVPEYMSYIDEIDFDLLNSIIGRLFSRCGIENPDRLNLNAARIFTELGSMGRYNPVGDTIGINMDKIHRTSDLRPQAKVAIILHTLVHEYLHSLSYQEVNYYGDEEQFINARIGLGQYGADVDEDQLITLDEGFNELLTERIVEEYITASGSINRVQYQEAFSEAVTKIDNVRTYDEETNIVKRLINYVAKESGVNVETVYEAMIREKFTGEYSLDIWRQILVDLLGEENGEDFHRVLVLASHSYHGSNRDLERELTVLDGLSSKSSFLARAVNFVKGCFGL